MATGRSPLIGSAIKFSLSMHYMIGAGLKAVLRRDANAGPSIFHQEFVQELLQQPATMASENCKKSQEWGSLSFAIQVIIRDF